MRRSLVILYMTLHPIPLNFYNIWGKFYFIFYQCVCMCVGFLVDTVKNDRGTPLKRKCLLILALFAIFKVKIWKNGWKTPKTYFVNVFKNPILHLSQVWEAPFCKNDLNSCTLNLIYSNAWEKEVGNDLHTVKRGLSVPTYLQRGI